MTTMGGGGAWAHYPVGLTKVWPDTDARARIQKKKKATSGLVLKITMPNRDRSLL